MKRVLPTALILLSYTSFVSAHEFWLESDPFITAPGSTIDVQIKIGQLFNGRSYPYLEHEAVSYHTLDESGLVPINAMTGDKPALRYSFNDPGYRMVGYESSAFHIQFDDTVKFVTYLRAEGLDSALDWYKTTGTSMNGATETYYRHAKTLAGTAGAKEPSWITEPMGHRLEIIPQRGITQCDSAPKFRVLWQGKPIEGLLVRRFKKDSKQSEELRTNSDGFVAFNAAEGAFLMNTVRIAKGDESPRGEGRDWYSDWASFTYECE